MLKSEMKVSIEITNHGDLLFSSGCSLNSVEKSNGLKQAHFLTFCLILKTFLKNDSAKSELSGLAEKKISYMNFSCINGHALRFKNYIWPQTMPNFLNFFPFFETSFFVKN